MAFEIIKLTYLLTYYIIIVIIVINVIIVMNDRILNRMPCSLITSAALSKNNKNGNVTQT